MQHPPSNVVIDWLNTIWNTDMPYQCKYIACYLRRFMNSQHDMAWPSYSRMVCETGLSKATLARYLATLESEGWVIRDTGSKGKNTIYTVSFPTSLPVRLVSHRDPTSLTQRHNYSHSETLIKQVIKQELNKELVNADALHSLANIYIISGQRLNFIKAFSKVANASTLEIITDALDILSTHLSSQPIPSKRAVAYCRAAIKSQEKQ